jgi:hypothetical protein
MAPRVLVLRVKIWVGDAIQLRKREIDKHLRLITN